MSALKLSVITPSFNQGRYIEQTITSVLHQSYPNIEYIIIDGDSRDQTVSIIKKYDGKVAYWESTTDHGQSHAINKGFRRCTGDIIAWLNSDDRYTEGTLEFVADFFLKNPSVDVIAGACEFINEQGKTLGTGYSTSKGSKQLLAFSSEYAFHQPSIFWRRSVLQRTGLLDESLHLIMDYDYWLRISRDFEIVAVDRVLSKAVRHDAAKTGTSFRAFTLARIKHALRLFGNPLTTTDWPTRLFLYRHLAGFPFKYGLKKLGLHSPKASR